MLVTGTIDEVIITCN